MGQRHSTVERVVHQTPVPLLPSTPPEEDATVRSLCELRAYRRCRRLMLRAAAHEGRHEVECERLGQRYQRFLRSAGFELTTRKDSTWVRW